MSNINIYPFKRAIVLEQKSQEQQNALLTDVNKDVNPLITPADYTPVYTTDKPIAGITDEVAKMKPSISVIEETPAPVPSTPTVQKEVAKVSKPQPLIGTIIATALVVTAGFFLYKRLYKGK